LTSNQSHSRLSRSTVKKAFTHGHAAYGGQNLDCVIYQSTIGRQTGALLHSKAHRTWVTYSTIHHALQTGGAEAHFVGNNIYVNIAKANHGIVINGANCVASIFNNHFYNSSTTYIISTTPTLRSGDINDSGNTWVRTRVIGPGTLTFKWSVSSEGNYDYLRFYIDSAEQFKISGSTTNQIKTVSIPVGSKTIMWKYTKDGGGSSGSDSGSVNDISYSGFPDSSFRPAPFKEAWGFFWETGGNQVWSNLSLRADPFINPNGILIQTAQRVAIQNNLFRNWHLFGNCVAAPLNPTDGLFVKGNAFWRSSGTWQAHAVHSPKGADRMIGNSPVPAPDICSYNYFQDNSKGVTGGIVNNNNFTGADPGFVNNANNWTLKNDSILKDKGPTEAEFNDHDNSRNDVGFRGGHRYDANGWNATKPVVLSADQSHFRLTKGDGVPLIIKARAAVSTP